MLQRAACDGSLQWMRIPWVLCDSSDLRLKDLASSMQTVAYAESYWVSKSARQYIHDCPISLNSTGTDGGPVNARCDATNATQDRRITLLSDRQHWIELSKIEAQVCFFRWSCAREQFHTLAVTPALQMRAFGHASTYLPRRGHAAGVFPIDQACVMNKRHNVHVFA